MSNLTKPRERRSRAIQLAAGKQQIMRLRDVEAITTLARSTIYRLLRLEQFPRPIRLGARASGWRSADIERWLTERHSSSGAKKSEDLSKQGGPQ